jgi:hypothetical protein
MTSSLKRQRTVNDLQQGSWKGRARSFSGIAFLWLLVVTPVQAAVFVVNSPSDVEGAAPLNDGICATGYKSGVPNGVCTLRAAIMEANHAPGGPHTINIPSGTYTLTIPSLGMDSEAAGALKIVASMNIIGAGSSTTIIDANGSFTNDRGFRVLGITANIEGITIRNGAVSKGGGFFPDGGGGIDNVGTLTLTNTTVRENSAVFGGGITNFGTLALINSTISGNSARGQGVFSHSGGIDNGKGVLILINTTVSNNHATSIAGGISNGVTLTMINSTVSGNTADFNGGGIHNSVATVNAFNSTITDNRADADLNGSGVGGGVFNTSGSTFNFRNTILAGNFETVFEPFVGMQRFVIRDCAGTLTSIGNNLMRVVNCTVIGSAPTVANPLLGPLQNNGGPTQTHALLAGSPAIDGGNPSGCRDNLGALLTTDQRGFSRPTDGNNDGLVHCDIGAYESFTGSNTSVVAALLPSGRSVQVGVPATVFATIINLGQGIAAACNIAPLTSVAANFQFQTTDPTTNQITGFPNVAANIPAGAAQSFILAVIPTAPFPPTDVQFSFDCANSDPAPINTGLNTLLLSASMTSVPDIVALAAASGGIVDIPGTNGSGAFAVATVNVGATGNITASADTGSASLPVSIFLCQTNPATGQCISVIGPTVTTTINANATPTFGIFVQGNGNVPFDPAVNRIFVRFKDGGNVTRGATSVAVRTQ